MAADRTPGCFGTRGPTILGQALVVGVALVVLGYGMAEMMSAHAPLLHALAAGAVSERGPSDGRSAPRTASEASAPVASQRRIERRSGLRACAHERERGIAGDCTFD